MNIDNPFITNFLLIVLLAMFIVQMFTFWKIARIIHQVNKLLFEIRLMFKHSGISYEPKKKAIMEYKICQYCRHRISFIQISDNAESDNFYYKCKKSNIEISLSSSCSEFERDIIGK